MNKEFYCKSKQISSYLIKNGSRLIRTEKDKGLIVFVFDYDDSIDKNLKQLESEKNRYLF